MTDKLELKSSHEVIDTVSVADVDSIFQGKPTDPDILTVVMKGGRRLYCDEVCPVDSLQKESISEDLEKELSRLLKDCEIDSEYIHQDFLHIVANHFSDWQKQQMMKDAFVFEYKHNTACCLASECLRNHGWFGRERVFNDLWRFICGVKELFSGEFKTGDKVKLIIIKQEEK